ncbi:UNVERIFIED_CONTAM: hypothetical protein FKN15_043852 [Acipenser sinensis]
MERTPRNRRHSKELDPPNMPGEPARENSEQEETERREEQERLKREEEEEEEERLKREEEERLKREEEERLKREEEERLKREEEESLRREGARGTDDGMLTQCIIVAGQKPCRFKCTVPKQILKMTKVFGQLKREKPQRK